MCNLCRKSLALGLLDQLDVERFLEVGIGAGDVMISLGKRGLVGRGIDFSEQAVATCRERIHAEGLAERLEVRQGDLLALSDETSYDLVIAFEVLEHIEDDHAALDRIRGLLRPHGYLLLSVPAHMSKWGATDVWAGHQRRYEREELQQKLHGSRFVIREFFSYGFPLLNLTRRVRNLVYARDVRRGETVQDRTMSSGIAPPTPVRLLRPMIPVFSWLVCQLQRPFLHSDLGEGYFVLAQREG